MKKAIIVIIALFCLGATITKAQPPAGALPPMTPEKREKIESMKVAFITQKLDLTPDEAKVFWPVYNQYQDELFKLRDNKRKEMREMKQNEANLTDKEYEQVFDGELTFRQAEVDIIKKYHPQLKKTLPVKKLAQLSRVDEEFKRELLHMIRDKDEKDGSSPKKKSK